MTLEVSIFVLTVSEHSALASLIFLSSVNKELFPTCLVVLLPEIDLSDVFYLTKLVVFDGKKKRGAAISVPLFMGDFDV